MGETGIQVVSGDGVFKRERLQGFMNQLHHSAFAYTVVAIMGPQSSGKSTLLNHLFHTNFPEMNALQRRGQTTRGIWMDKAEGTQPPFTLVMDMEGTDGRERGQDDTAFERQSALFALAVADVVVINMWCHDIGREHAANKPLLRIVFQVMMQLFSHRKSCKTTLLFVIRDKTETPLHILENILRDDIHMIWKAVPKPRQYAEAPLSAFFNVEVEALSSTKEEHQFKKEVAELRHKYFQCTYGRRGDPSGFTLTAEEIWKRIKQNKDLDLPALNVMVATVRCQQISGDKFKRLASSKDWLALKKAVEIGDISGFGRNASSILKRYLSEYDSESMCYEQVVRNENRKDLELKILELMKPIHSEVLDHLRINALEHFKTEVEIQMDRGIEFSHVVVNCKEVSMRKFDKGCSDAAIENTHWDASKFSYQLVLDIGLHASAEKERRKREKQAKVMAGVATGVAAVAAVGAAVATGGAAIAAAPAIVGGGHAGAAGMAAAAAAASSLAASVPKLLKIKYSK